MLTTPLLTPAPQIRINPGNFADGRKTFEERNYDDPAQFEAERAEIEEVRGFEGGVSGVQGSAGGWLGASGVFSRQRARRWDGECGGSQVC
jgi:hypothetical protein